MIPFRGNPFSEHECVHLRITFSEHECVHLRITFSEHECVHFRITSCQGLVVFVFLLAVGCLGTIDIALGVCLDHLFLGLLAFTLLCALARGHRQALAVVLKIRSSRVSPHRPSCPKATRRNPRRSSLHQQHRWNSIAVRADYCVHAMLIGVLDPDKRNPDVRR